MFKIDRKMMRFLAIVHSAVLLKGSLVVGGYFLGKHLDERMGTYPLFMLVLVLLGFVIGFAWIVFVATRK